MPQRKVYRVESYIIEAHLHTLGNSRCGHTAPADIMKLYSEAGYDGIVCTNHFSRYIYEEYLTGDTEAEKLAHFFKAFEELKAYKETNGGPDVFFGVEVAIGRDDYHLKTNFDCAEILVYGITPDEFAEHAEEITETDYTGLRRLADENGWLLYQAHPFRERTKRLKRKYLDGIEVYNANPRHMNFNMFSRIKAGAQKLRTVAGSDFHKPHDIGAAMLLERRPENEKDLAAVLKAGEYSILRRKP